MSFWQTPTEATKLALWRLCYKSVSWTWHGQPKTYQGSLTDYDVSHSTLTVTAVNSIHYSDVIMGAIASQITSLTIVYSTVYSGADQRKHQSSASPVFVRGIHRWPGNSPHKGPVTRKIFLFDDVIMINPMTWQSTTKPRVCKEWKSININVQLLTILYGKNSMYR